MAANAEGAWPAVSSHKSYKKDYKHSFAQSTSICHCCPTSSTQCGLRSNTTFAFYHNDIHAPVGVFDPLFESRANIESTNSACAIQSKESNPAMSTHHKSFLTWYKNETSVEDERIYLRKLLEERQREYSELLDEKQRKYSELLEENQQKYEELLEEKQRRYEDLLVSYYEAMAEIKFLKEHRSHISDITST
ncbi:hypothetical protein BGW42_007732 [Actinomortierella wolfii]|nr:hypothetical protein BGW42_007732 [Actinomortierella wolfii]